MIKVTIDLWPYGQEDRKRTISEFYVANDGTGDEFKGRYIFKRKEDDPWEKSVTHLRKEGVEKLVQAVIEKHYD